MSCEIECDTGNELDWVVLGCTKRIELETGTDNDDDSDNDRRQLRPRLCVCVCVCVQPRGFKR